MHRASFLVVFNLPSHLVHSCCALLALTFGPLRVLCVCGAAHQLGAAPGGDGCQLRRGVAVLVHRHGRYQRADRAPPLPANVQRPPRGPRARGQGDVQVRTEMHTWSIGGRRPSNVTESRSLSPARRGLRSLIEPLQATDGLLSSYVVAAVQGVRCGLQGLPHLLVVPRLGPQVNSPRPPSLISRASPSSFVATMCCGI